MELLEMPLPTELAGKHESSRLGAKTQKSTVNSGVSQMGLKFPVEWKFDDLQEAMPARAVTDFHELVTVIASGCPDRWRIFETFKSAFGRSAGSSSESWAESDSEIAMSNYAANAPKFIDALWMGIDGVRSQVGVPSHDIINAILSKHGVPLKIDPPNLVLMRGDITVLNNGTSS